MQGITGGLREANSIASTMKPIKMRQTDRGVTRERILHALPPSILMFP